MKVSMWKVLGIIGLLADELTKAGVDNRITVDEALLMVARIAPTVGLQFDETGSSFVMDLLTKLMNAASDKKITITEAIQIIQSVCNTFGIDFDKEGIDV